MAGPISLLSLTRHLSNSSNNPRPSRRNSKADEEEERQAAVDAEENEELREMEEEDEAYRDRLARLKRREENGGDDAFGLGGDDVRAESPSRMTDRDEDEIVPAPAKTFGRTVTINEPIRDSFEKGSTVSGAAMELPYTRTPPKRRVKRFSDFRSDTMTSYATVSSLLSEAWERRHDPNHKGFWAAFWPWLVGSKTTGENGPREGDPDYVPPKYRWTPILSGLLQPFSILLEIPGLTEHWYVKQVNGVAINYQDNPIILDVGLAISITCAVIANVALISRFLERRVLTSTIVCIVMLSIHDIINITAVTIFGIIHGVDDGFDYSEAFWMCVCSTTASFFTNVTLIYDLFKTREFRKSGSGLTPKQRKLVIIVMILLVYIALGALCFNFLIPDIAFQNALYFTVVSIETIGFGDIGPTTVGSKIFLFFYVPIGILNLAVTVGTARDTLVESWSAAYRRRRHEVVRRHRERKQQRMEENIRRMAIEKQLEAIGKPVYVHTRGGGVRGGAKSKKLNVRALTKDQLDAAELEAIETIASQSVSAPNGASLPESADAHDRALADVQRLQDELTQQSLLSEEGYKEFQERMAHEERMENLFKFAFAAGLFVVFWVVGATIFARTEDWDYFTGLYFCFVTFTTIGYGDVTPVSPAGRAVFIIWAIVGVAIVTLLIAVLTEAYANSYKSALLQRNAKRAMTAISKSNADTTHGLKEEEKELDHKRAERLPHEVVDLLKTWHAHVAAIRQGALEGQESEEINALLKLFLEEQNLNEVEKKELLADPESRKMLFWNGYERAVHRLVNVAEHAIHHHEKTQRKLTILSGMSPMSTMDSKASLGAGYLGGRTLARTVTRTGTRDPHGLDATSGMGQNAHVEGGPVLGPIGENDAAWTSQPEILASPEGMTSAGALEEVGSSRWNRPWGRRSLG